MRVGGAGLETVAVTAAVRRIRARTPEAGVAAAAAALARTVTAADRLLPRYVAVMVTGVAAATVDVVTVKVLKVCPAGTVTLAGTWAAAGLLLESVTTAPPDGAEPVSTSVALIEVPPVALPGFVVKVSSTTYRRSDPGRL